MFHYHCLCSSGLNDRCCALPQELYERLVEAERLRAEAEKQRGDDLSKIVMMLASSKGEQLKCCLFY
jgi:hypothetical protein